MAQFDPDVHACGDSPSTWMITLSNIAVFHDAECWERGNHVQYMLVQTYLYLILYSVMF